MKFEMKKYLIKYELGDLARLIEQQESDTSLYNLEFNERL